MFNVLIDPSSERKIIDLRKMKFRDIYVLGRYNYTYAHKPLEKHSHGRMLEICLQDEGTQSYNIEGTGYCLKGGDVLLTFPNEKHGSGGAPLNRGRLYWLIIRIPATNERFLNLPPEESHTLVDGLLSAKPRHFKGRRMLKFYLEKIFEAHDSGDVALQKAEITNWTLRFLLDVLSDARHFAASSVSYQVKQALDHISLSTRKDLVPLKKLADIAKLSLPRFKARFKQETGFTPHNYMMLQKIASAKDDISGSRKSLTEIAIQFGFSSSQYFSTVFKRYTGKSPTEFRKHPHT